jgi:hypothetical protein
MSDQIDKKELKQYAAELLRQRKTTPEIEQALMQKGLDRSEIKKLLDDLYSGDIKKQNFQDNVAAKVGAIAGIVIIIVGIVMSNASYREAASSPTGGTYRIYFNVMIFGVVVLVAAAAQSQRD